MALLEDDYRDPAFTWAAYTQAYDPATGGKNNPSARRKKRVSAPPDARPSA